MKKCCLISLCAIVALLALTSTGTYAYQATIGNQPLDWSGYISMSGGLSLKDGDHYDTESDLQTLLTNFYIEGTYRMTDNLSFFGSGKLTFDWIYDLKHDDQSWNDKLFNESKNNLYFDDEYWQLLNEAHMSYSKGPLFIRAGKQIVSWGQMDGFRLMDQINPQDLRRGFADVEFENSIIPIWLIRSEYYQPVMSDWIQEFGVQFIFNPNVDFISDQGIEYGNAAGGIWAPNVEVPLGGLYPNDYARLGKAYNTIDEPDGSDGMEYGVKIEALAWDTLFSINCFYGRSNSPVLRTAGTPTTSIASDGRTLLHLQQEGYYPRQKFVGATLSRDVPFLGFGFGSAAKFNAPVLRLESFYAFDSTFVSNMNQFENFNEFRWAIALDYKIRIPFLNPASTFSLTSQFYHQYIEDYPSYDLAAAEDNNYAVTVYLSTSYMNAKLTPSIYWQRDINNKADFYKLSVSYAPTSNWKYTVGALLMEGSEKQKGYDLFNNKDQFFFTIERSFF